VRLISARLESTGESLGLLDLYAAGLESERPLDRGLRSRDRDRPALYLDLEALRLRVLLERFLSLDRDLDLRSLDRLSFDLSLLLLDLDLLSLDRDLLLSLDFDLRLDLERDLSLFLSLDRDLDLDFFLLFFLLLRWLLESSESSLRLILCMFCFTLL